MNAIACVITGAGAGLIVYAWAGSRIRKSGSRWLRGLGGWLHGDEEHYLRDRP